MSGLEPIIRPFMGDQVTPQRFIPDSGNSAPPVRLAVGIVGGTKTFSFSNSTNLSSYMASVHTEKPSNVFDMSTGELRG